MTFKKINTASIKKPEWTDLCFGVLTIGSISLHWLVLAIAPIALYRKLFFGKLRSISSIESKIIMINLLALMYACYVIAERGAIETNAQFILQSLYSVIAPIIIITYRPDNKTVDTLNLGCLILLIVDFSVNATSFYLGHDLFGRELDLRDGITGGARFGGAFGHSFVSGIISVCALAYSLSSRRWVFVVLSLFNLTIAGSFRNLVPLVGLPIFYFSRKRISRLGWLLTLLSLSALAITSVILTSSYVPSSFPFNPASDLRIFSWEFGLSRMFDHPFVGSGWPITNELKAVNEEIIESNLITESWFLTNAVAFGIPFMLLKFYSLYSVVSSYLPRIVTPMFACIGPITIIDLFYGQNIDQILYCNLFWAVAIASIARKNMPCHSAKNG